MRRRCPAGTSRPGCGRSWAAGWSAGPSWAPGPTTASSGWTSRPGRPCWPRSTPATAGTGWGPSSRRWPCWPRAAWPACPGPTCADDALLYGVYSFEPGARKAPADLDARDGRAAAAFAAALHAFGPDEAGAAGGALGPANPACFSVADQLALIEERLGSFEAAAADPGCAAEVRALARALDLRAAVARLVARATAGLTPDEVARALPRAARRLTTSDFGPHNFLFGDRGLTVVDFEGAGWDDPARMVMGFVAHAGSDGLPPPAAEAFLGAYAAARGLSAAEVARFERVGRLADVEWATVYAEAMTPAAIAPKRFGIAGFDVSAHLAACVTRTQGAAGPRRARRRLPVPAPRPRAGLTKLYPAAAGPDRPREVGRARSASRATPARLAPTRRPSPCA